VVGSIATTGSVDFDAAAELMQLLQAVASEVDLGALVAGISSRLQALTELVESVAQPLEDLSGFAAAMRGVDEPAAAVASMARFLRQLTEVPTARRLIAEYGIPVGEITAALDAAATVLGAAGGLMGSLGALLPSEGAGAGGRLLQNRITLRRMNKLDRSIVNSSVQVNTLVGMNELVTSALTPGGQQDAVSTAALKLWDELDKTALQSAVTFSGKFSDMKADILSLISTGAPTNFPPDVQAAFKRMINKMEDHFLKVMAGLLSFINGAVESGLSELGTFLKTALDSIWEGIKKAWEPAGTCISVCVGASADASVKDLGAWAADFVKAGGPLATVSAVAGEVVNTLGVLASAVRDFAFGDAETAATPPLLRLEPAEYTYNGSVPFQPNGGARAVYGTVDQGEISGAPYRIDLNALRLNNKGSAFARVRLDPRGFMIKFRMQVHAASAEGTAGEGMHFIIHNDPKEDRFLDKLEQKGYCCGACGLQNGISVFFDDRGGVLVGLASAAKSSLAILTRTSGGGGLVVDDKVTTNHPDAILISNETFGQWYDGPSTVTITYNGDLKTLQAEVVRESNGKSVMVQKNFTEGLLDQLGCPRSDRRLDKGCIAYIGWSASTDSFHPATHSVYPLFFGNRRSIRPAPRLNVTLGTPPPYPQECVLVKGNISRVTGMITTSVQEAASNFERKIVGDLEKFPSTREVIEDLKTITDYVKSRFSAFLGSLNVPANLLEDGKTAMKAMKEAGLAFGDAFSAMSSVLDNAAESLGMMQGLLGSSTTGSSAASPKAGAVSWLLRTSGFYGAIDTVKNTLDSLVTGFPPDCDSVTDKVLSALKVVGGIVLNALTGDALAKTGTALSVLRLAVKGAITFGNMLLTLTQKSVAAAPR
jgi:hypothetical protein